MSRYLILLPAPEAALAREQRICYATLALVTDMDAGVAALHGLARGFDRKIILYYSGSLRWVATARDPEDRNLMLQHSADRLIHRLDELPDAVAQLLAT